MAYTKYSLTPSSNNAAPPDGAPEGMLPSAVNDTMRDMMAQIRDCGDGIRGGTYTMTAPVITGGSINGTTTITTSGAISYTGTLTGGTGVVNLGSGQFYKDASGNVGIGTSSPNNKLQVLGTIKVATGNAQGILGLGDGAGSTVNCGVWRGAANAPTSDGNYLNFGGYDGLVFATGNAAIGSQTERMRIDSSGNVLIGSSTNSFSAKVYSLQSSATEANNLALYTTGGSHNTTRIALYNDSNSCSIQSIANNLSFSTNGVGSSSERMRIDSSGNLGLGTTTPSTGSLNRQLTINSGASSLGGVVMQNNATGTAFNDGFQIFLNALDGNITNNEAGSVIFATSATERMRVDAAGDVQIGTTVAGASKLRVNGGSGFGAYISSTTAGNDTIVAWNQATSGNNTFAGFYTEGTITIRGSISYNRGAGLTAYNVTSDYRAKDIIGSVLDSGEVIDSVPVYMGKMKDATQARPMFIAHETPDYAHTGEKDAVDKDGKPVYQQMDASSLVPVLWAEVQSLRKRLAILESK